MNTKDRKIPARLESWYRFHNSHLTVDEVADMMGVCKNKIRRWCREKNPWDAKKQVGTWWIPFTGLYPVLAEPEHDEARAEFSRLRHEYPLHSVGLACVLLESIDDYTKRVLQFLSEGTSEAESRALACHVCATSLYRMERLCSEYSRNGLRGLIDYSQACHYITGCVDIDSGADLVHVANTVNESKGSDKTGQPLSIRWYLDFVSGHSDNILNETRKAIEESEEGRRIVKTNPNRRLYAVLEPTREENLARIEYALTGLGPFGLFELLASVKLAIDIYENDDSDTG